MLEHRFLTRRQLLHRTGMGMGAVALAGVLPIAPALRMIVVAGPRIDPATLPAYDGLELHGYVHDLYRHLAACDLAVVQGGLTTTMELTAARRPFIYVPLRHHFEQNFHVRHRLDRYRAGRCLDYQNTEPESLAQVIAEEMGRLLPLVQQLYKDRMRGRDASDPAEDDAPAAEEGRGLDL